MLVVALFLASVFCAYMVGQLSAIRRTDKTLADMTEDELRALADRVKRRKEARR